MVSARAEMKKTIVIGIMTTMVGRVSRPPPNMFQFQIHPVCWVTISVRFIVPASRMTLMMTRPIETS
ncbi:hypothetical protein D3C81_1374650 [compost metagenome]